MTHVQELTKRVVETLRGETNQDVITLMTVLLAGCVSDVAPSKQEALALLGNVFATAHMAVDRRYDEIKRESRRH